MPSRQYQVGAQTTQPAPAPTAGGITIEGYQLIFAVCAAVILIAAAGKQLKKWATAEVVRDIQELKHDAKNDRMKLASLEVLGNNTSRDVAVIIIRLDDQKDRMDEHRVMLQRLLDKME